MSDLRSGMGDGELMKRYALSEGLFHRVLQKLIDAGEIDEIELLKRTSISDTAVTKAFLETRGAVQKVQNAEEKTIPRGLNDLSDIEITEKIKISDTDLRRLFSRLPDD